MLVELNVRACDFLCQLAWHYACQKQQKNVNGMNKKKTNQILRDGLKSEEMAYTYITWSFCFFFLKKKRNPVFTI